MSEPLMVVFVHGWSVHNTDTYGELPQRLLSESAAGNCPPLDIHNIFLGKYISFHDEVRLEDISRAFQAALQSELGPQIAAGQRFACITHSTGGPVTRDWWQRYSLDPKRPCPMSHLIMLAPANFGSALAQLGKGTIGRLKSWWDGIEPGQKVLGWLELGSPEAWQLNRAWIEQTPDFTAGNAPVFPFVLTGQSIDRKLYDHINSYTGELGSDGAVRVAAANLNSTYVRLEQQQPDDDLSAAKLVLTQHQSADPTAIALLPGRAHSGETMGILRSVKDNAKPHPTVKAVLACLKVTDGGGYEKTRQQFARQNLTVRKKERVERHHNKLFPDNVYFHDACSMLVLRLRDDQGHPIDDFDLLFTGKNNNPNNLPPSFYKDSQRNSRDGSTMTYFLNHDQMHGLGPVEYKGKTVRKALPGVRQLGLQISPRPTSGFVHYLPATLSAALNNIEKFCKPDQTTMVDIVLRRMVHKGTFELTRELGAGEFKGQEPGGLVD